jgi:large subunit ribosomal protein L5
MMLTKERQQKAFEALSAEQGYKNRMAAPRIEKVIVSTGVGKKRDKKVLELIQDRLAKITGQKAAPRSARISIASFKVRQGDVVGFQTTLRGPRMYDFLDKLIHVALPRTRDFRGISPTAVDEMGNITIGIKEHTIFPETSDEEVKDVFGLAVTIVTSAKSKKEATAFFKYLSVPLQNKEGKK